jgi:hypothetical protein
MEINIVADFDEKPFKAELRERMERAYKNTGINAIDNFFSARPIGTISGTGVREMVKGEGLKEIEDFLITKFCDVAFQERIDAYFEANWQRIFEEGMQKAIEHHVKKIAFNKAKERVKNEQP